MRRASLLLSALTLLVLLNVRLAAEAPDAGHPKDPRVVDRKMPDLAAQGLVRAALERCVAKVEKCQSEDGSFNQGGWAPVLGSTFACKALQTANAKGVRVDSDVLARAEDYLLGLHNKETGQFASAAGAGVSLYSTSGALY